MATWLAMEIWRSQNAGDIAIKMTPAGGGRVGVYLDVVKIFDSKEEGGKYPEMNRGNELKMVIGDKIFEIDEARAQGQ